MLSGDKSGLLRQLNCLSPTLRRQLREQSVRVRLHGILAHEQPFGDLSIAQPGGHRLEDLELPGRNPELLKTRIIPLERAADRDRNGDLDSHRYLASHDRFLRARKLEAEPDTEDGEDHGDDPTVD